MFSMSSSLCWPLEVILLFLISQPYVDNCVLLEAQNSKCIYLFLQTGKQLYRSDVSSHLDQEEQLSREGIGFLQSHSQGELQAEPSQWVGPKKDQKQIPKF